MKLIKAILQGDIDVIKEIWEKTPKEFFNSQRFKISDLFNFQISSTSKQLPAIRLMNQENRNIQVQPNLSDYITINPLQLLAATSPYICSTLKNYGVFSPLYFKPFSFNISSVEHQCDADDFYKFLKKLSSFDFTFSNFAFQPNPDAEVTFATKLPFTLDTIYQFIKTHIFKTVKNIEWDDNKFKKAFENISEPMVYSVFKKHVSLLIKKDSIDEITSLRKRLYSAYKLNTDHRNKLIEKMNQSVEQYYTNESNPAFLKIIKEIKRFFLKLELDKAPVSLDFSKKVKKQDMNNPEYFRNISELEPQEKIQLFESFIDVKYHNDYNHFITLIVNPGAIRKLSSLKALVVEFLKHYSASPQCSLIKDIPSPIATVLKKINEIPEYKRMKLSLLHDIKLNTAVQANPAAQPVPVAQLADNLGATFFGKSQAPDKVEDEKSETLENSL